jgi:hypothetical protein
MHLEKTPTVEGLGPERAGKLLGGGKILSKPITALILQ